MIIIEVKSTYDQYKKIKKQFKNAEYIDGKTVIKIPGNSTMALGISFVLKKMFGNSVSIKTI